MSLFSDYPNIMSWIILWYYFNQIRQTNTIIIRVWRLKTQDLKTCLIVENVEALRWLLVLSLKSIVKCQDFYTFVSDV